MSRSTGLGDLHGIRVLAIDDEEDALTLLRVVLETAGAEVTTVALAAHRAGAHRSGATRTCSSSISACPRWTASS